MSKLYKAIDKRNVEHGNRLWLVNEKGVAVGCWRNTDNENIPTYKLGEHLFYYDPVSRFENDAIDPVLIAEW